MPYNPDPQLPPEAARRLGEAKTYVKENLNNKNQKLIEQDLWTPDKLYLEFALCKDYYLGSVYYLLAHDPKYHDQRAQIIKQIADNISAWQDRVWDDWDFYFPNFPITGDMIADLIADQKNHDEIFRLSPNTVYYALLRDDILTNINHSHVRGEFSRIYIDTSDDGRHLRTYRPISLMINTFPLTLSQKRQDEVGPYIANLYGVDVTIMSKDPSTFGPEDSWLRTIEQFYINKIGVWTKGEFIKSKIYESVGNIEKYIDKMPLTDPRMARIIEGNPAWFAKCKMLARCLFDKEFRTPLVKDKPVFAIDAVLNHMCLFVDLSWSPSVATRFKPPPPTPSRTEELSDQLSDALSRYK